MSYVSEDYVYYTDQGGGDERIIVILRIVDTQFTYYVQVISSEGSNLDMSISTGTAQCYIDGVAQTSSSFTTGIEGLVVTRSDTIAGVITNATSTVRLVVNARGTEWYNPSESAGDTPSVSYDKTFTVKKPASITQNVLTAATLTQPWIVFLPTTNTLNLLHIKNTGSEETHIRVTSRSVDGSTNSRRMPVGSGMTLIQDGSSNWFIGSYFNGTALTTGSATGGTTATSPIVLADITSGNKTVALPNPATFASSYLCICAYTTGTSTTNNLIIVTNGYSRETASASYSFATASGPSLGLFLVSDGTKWNIMGIYRGTNTTFDQTTSVYTSLPCVAGIANLAPDAITPTVTPLANSGAFHIWKTRTISWGNGAVIGNGTNYVVNSGFNRFYHNTDIDYSAFLFVNTKVGSGGTPTIFPVAKYPSDN
jgi:hypothetical protein